MMKSDINRKVCILSTVHRALDTRVFFREALTLVKAGYQVHLLVRHDCDEEIQGVRIKALPRIKNTALRMLLLPWLGLFLALRQQADIYHIHDPELIFVGLVLRIISGSPVIYDVHEHYPDALLVKTWLPESIRKLVSRFFDNLERRLSNFFSALIVADSTIQDRFKNSRSEMIVVYNYPKQVYYLNCPEQNRDEIHKYPHQLIYVGAINTHRGLWVMVEMIDLLIKQYQVDVGLWLIGHFGFAREHDEFIRKVKLDKELQERIQHIGRIPFPDVPRYLMKADIGLVPLQPIPKYYKNIPTKLFEYMAAGIPILGSDLPPIREYVLGNEAGLVAEPTDPSSHAEQVNVLMQSAELAEQFGANGKVAFLEKYQWETESEKMLDLYNDLVE
jgi:glycosyltransferase involved in cell wall biosynthesis